MTDYAYVYIKGHDYYEGVDNVYIMKSDDVKLFVELVEILDDYYDFDKEEYSVQAKKFNSEPLPDNSHHSWCNYRDLESALMEPFKFLENYDDALFELYDGGPLEASVYYRLKHMYEDNGIEFQDIQEVFDFVDKLKGK